MTAHDSRAGMSEAKTIERLVTEADRSAPGCMTVQMMPGDTELPGLSRAASERIESELAIIAFLTSAAFGAGCSLSNVNPNARSGAGKTAGRPRQPGGHIGRGVYVHRDRRSPDYLHQSDS
jgi:hypothetical protein